MELRHLRYFLTLSEELSFVRAADKLCIAQPPLSRQIKELEDEIGAKLFERNNKRVELTDAGKYFKTEIDALLISLEAIKKHTQKIGNHISGEYNIGYISSTFSGDISELLKFLSEKYPYVNFRLYEAPTQKQINALELGKIDLGIVRGPITIPQIQSQFWYRDSFSLIFNKLNHNIKYINDLKSLKDTNFVFFNKNYAPHFYNTLLAICATHGFTPKVMHETNNVSSIVQMVINGLGLSIVPTTVLKSHQSPELGHFTISDPRFFSDVLIVKSSKGMKEIDQAATNFLLGKM